MTSVWQAIGCVIVFGLWIYSLVISAESRVNSIFGCDCAICGRPIAEGESLCGECGGAKGENDDNAK